MISRYENKTFGKQDDFNGTNNDTFLTEMINFCHSLFENNQI